MGEVTKIQWCDHTFNPWIGCHKIAPECLNCYAAVGTFPRTQRAHGRELWGLNAERHVTSAGNWKQVSRWNLDAAKAGERRRVFCASLSDVMEDRRDLDAPRADLFELVEVCTSLDFLLLTKRPKNFATLTPERWRHGRWPRNAWAGTTAGCMKTARKHIPHLLQAAPDAPVRFVSYEPALELVDFTRIPVRDGELNALRGTVFYNNGGMSGDRPRLDWVIIGGESGSGHRPFDLRWARNVVRECRNANVACFMKQTGEDALLDGLTFPTNDRKGGDPEEWPEDIRVRQWPKSHAATPRSSGSSRSESAR